MNTLELRLRMAGLVGLGAGLVIFIQMLAGAFSLGFYETDIFQEGAVVRTNKLTGEIMVCSISGGGLGGFPCNVPAIRANDD